MLTAISLVVDIGLATSGLFTLALNQFLPENGCDLAMVQTPGLIATEIRPGDGEPVIDGQLVRIRFSIADESGRVIANSSRWGLDYVTRFGKDEFWTPILWQIKKGEERQIHWVSIKSGQPQDIIVSRL